MTSPCLLCSFVLYYADVPEHAPVADVNMTYTAERCSNYTHYLLMTNSTASADVFQITTYATVSLMTIAGNLLVIGAFMKDTTLRVRLDSRCLLSDAMQAIANYWIVSLSSTDIILATIVLPFRV